MKIVMLTTQLGSRTGVLAEQFHAGHEYDLTGTAGERDMAAVFVREGWAQELVVKSNGEGDEASRGDESQGEAGQPEAASRRKRSAAK